MSVRPEIRALAPYRFAARPHLVKLDQNESPYDLPSAIKARALKHLAQLPFNRYPEMQGESLRQAIAAYHDWPIDGVVISGGSNILIQSFVIACGIGQTVLTVSPSFAVYAMSAELLGAKLSELPLNLDFSLPHQALRQELSQGSGVFFLANPAAPTGNVFSEAELRELIELAAPNWTVVIDEAYYQFSRTDFSGLAKEYPHVASLRTFSKAFGLGGVRLGYALMQPELAQNLQKTMMPFSVSSLQLAIGLAVLEHSDLLEPRVREVETERERLLEALSKIEGVSANPSETNFFLIKVSEPQEFFAQLLKCGVLVRRQDHLPGLSGYLRVSIGTPQENDAFLEAVKAITGEFATGVNHG